MKGDIDKEFAQENLKRISANFELELLRLIRTLNLISQSKELYKGQITFIQAFTDKYKLGLSDFTIRLLDLERNSREPSQPHDAENLFGAPVKPSLTPANVAGIVHELREYLNKISTEIESNKDEYLNMLDSVYSVYNLQLGASQTDLDVKLRELQKEISRAAESNGAGIGDKDKPGAVTGIDYVKPTLQQPETAKPRARNIDYIGPDEPDKQASRKAPPQAADVKPKPEIKSTAKTAAGEADKDARIKNSYVIGAGLLILGIIVGVLFYDMLMRMWGVEEVSVTDRETSSVSSAKKEPSAVNPPAIGKNNEKAPGDAALDNKPLSPAKPADAVKADKSEVSAQTKAQPPAILKVKMPAEAPAPETAGSAESYTVVGVGANVRSGPGMGNDVVTYVKEGDVFRGLGEKQGRWVKIETPDGKEGWISTKVIREID